MIIISDTSVLNYIVQIGAADLLPQLFKEIIIPEEVARELKNAADSRLSALLNCSWVKSEPARDKSLVQQLARSVDQGEAEAIALALEQKADYLLIDEARGRQEAAKLNITIVGLLGIFVLAKTGGYIPAVKPLTDRLITLTNFRYSASLIQQVLITANEQQ